MKQSFHLEEFDLRHAVAEHVRKHGNLGDDMRIDVSFHATKDDRTETVRVSAVATAVKIDRTPNARD